MTYFLDILLHLHIAYGSMTFRLNAFGIKDILPKCNSSERHFVENDISSKFHLKLSKILSKNKKRRY